MDGIIDALPLLIPIIILQYTLAIFAIVHIIKHPKYRFGNQFFWILFVFFIQFIGPIVYFLFGRGDDQ